MAAQQEHKTSDEGSTLTCQVMVANEHGLHARPAGVLAQKAMVYQSDITIASEDQEVDAKSILDILTLAAGQGSPLELRASGADAEVALRDLSELFKNKFNEA